MSEVKKKIEPILGKVIEGDQKKTLDKLKLNKKLLMFFNVTEGDEKKQAIRNIAGKKFFITFFFGMFFYLPKLTGFSRKSATIQCARWAEKNTCFW